MAFKRTATTDLNHENWDNEDEETEEAGTFAKAPEEVLEKRIVKTARRRIQNSGGDGTPKSAFGSFAGFKATPAAATTAAAAASSPFSFLANLKPNPSTTAPTNSNPILTKTTTSNGSIIAAAAAVAAATAATTITTTTPENGLGALSKSPSKIQSTSKVDATEQSESSDEKSSVYYAKLKGLNEGVAQWIKKHVDSNPFCILTPIFRDYEKYLQQIELKHGKEVKTESSSKAGGNIADKKQPLVENLKETTAPAPAVNSSEKKVENSVFGNATAGTWKPEKSIFGNTSSTKSIFGTETKTENKPMFGGSVSQEKNPFLNKSAGEEIQLDKSKTDLKPAPSSAAVSFPSATFSFGASSSNNTAASAGFSFGSAKPFSFGAQVAKPEDKDEKPAAAAATEEKDEDEDVPPKPDFKPVTEEGSIFEQRCKVYVKKDGNYSDRGVGTLFLKPTPNEKMQLIVRAVNSLGNILLNTLLSENIPLKRMNKNTVMMVCLPTPESQPPPTSVLLRVKTSEDADNLMEALEKNKK